MARVTNLMISNTMIGNINRHKLAMQKIEIQLASGTKVQKPSDEPIIAATQMLLNSRKSELKQYSRNTGEGLDRMMMIDGQLNQLTETFQRLRYLTVQAANGTNGTFELKEAIGREINQHLNSMLDIANAKDATGRNLFGGSQIEKNPFAAIYSASMDPGSNSASEITNVRYQGDITQLTREIERNESVSVSLPGNRVFWGTNMSISSNTDSSNFVSMGEQSFSIDGFSISVSAGDTLDDIIDKINNSPVDVVAAKGSQDDLILSTKTPHQIWLQDEKGGTVLQDLGLIENASTGAPNNISANATVSGMSIFDVVISLRDDLYRGDQELIGGRDLEALDSALENILRYRSEIGARMNRMELHAKRLDSDEMYTMELLAKNESLDPAESIMQLKNLENVHQYALRVGAGIIKPTLMDFLR